MPQTKAAQWRRKGQAWPLGLNLLSAMAKWRWGPNQGCMSWVPPGPAAAFVMPWPVAWHGNILLDMMINQEILPIWYMVWWMGIKYSVVAFGC